MAQPPRETYTKGTQTNISLVQPVAIEAAKSASDALVSETVEQVAAANSSAAKTDTSTTVVPAVPALAPPQWRVGDAHSLAVTQSDEFARFVAAVVPSVERAVHLNQRFDVLANFARSATDNNADRAANGGLRARAPFVDERWCRKRSVMALEWSRAQPALLAVAMTAPETATTGSVIDPDGVVCVWSAGNLLERPEFVFTCSSQVTSIAFANFQPTVLIGGTYSGQVVLWDSRAGSAPVQRALVSATGHTHPVYSASLVGTAAAHNLVTASTDGRMCVWTLDNLAEPIETLELVSPAAVSAPSTPAAAAAGGAPGTPATPGGGAFDPPTTPRAADSPAVSTPTRVTVAASGISLPVGATAVRFQQSETNAFLCGSESGDVWRGFRHGAHSGLHERFAGHSAPVTGLDWHPTIAAGSAGGAGGASSGSLPLFLSSSADWTVRLWHAKHGAAGALRTFETARDFVCDVQWSPVHPALFATVDGSGDLAVWNINQSLEEPTARVTVDAQHALHKVAWHSDGRILAVGDASGKTHLFDVLDDVALPSSDESERFERTIKQLLLEQNQLN